jgi:hypothetical protein|tara:strand:- start:414 stop:1274 length:861 start_codon:yes stop_codon:yes gene_type:complete
MNKTKKKAVQITNIEIEISIWLEKATQELQTQVFTPAKLRVPNQLRLNVGSMTGTAKDRNHTLGCCYRKDVANGVNMITLNISTTQAKDSGRVLDVLVHELIHAIDNNKHGHKGEFRKMALAVGLKGKMTATIATKKLKKVLAGIVKKIGKFPTKAVSLEGLQKDVNRNLKLECNGTDDVACDHGFNINKTRIQEMSSHTCLCCGVGEYHVKLPAKYGAYKLTISKFFALNEAIAKGKPTWELWDLIDTEVTEYGSIKPEEVQPSQSVGEQLADEVFASIIPPLKS